MMAMKKMLEQEPSEIEMLLPWHAAGTLNARDARRVDEALARDPALARQYAAIREEYAETIGLNESLGAPSARAMVGVAQPLGANCRILREPVAADAGLVGEPWRGGAVVAGRRDRRGAGEEPKRSVPGSIAEHECAHHPRFGAGSAAARAGAVRAGRARRRHHGTARQLSGLDR
jgi:hypothetical protein